jgi:hypothetical protein
MKMSHMIATSVTELHAMAVHIGVARHWYQGDHYDISLGKKELALAAGAVLITWRQASAMDGLRKRGHDMGDPQTAPDRFKALLAAARLARTEVAASTEEDLA